MIVDGVENSRGVEVSGRGGRVWRVEDIMGRRGY